MKNKWGGKRKGAGRKRTLPGRAKVETFSCEMLVKHKNFLKRKAQIQKTTTSRIVHDLIESRVKKMLIREWIRLAQEGK